MSIAARLGPACQTAARSTPACSAPACSTPASSAPACSTPASSTPFRSDQLSFARACRTSAFATLALLLGACAVPAPGGGAFRAPSAPIYSSASLDPARLTGRWSQVAAFAQPGAPGCGPAGVDIAEEGAGLRIAGTLCLDGRRLAVAGRLAPAGPGRLAFGGASRPAPEGGSRRALAGSGPRELGQPWWVLWADTDVRTLVVGTPSGAFGFILDRGALPADRAVAARQILAFNGYDTARLVAVPASDASPAPSAAVAPAFAR